MIPTALLILANVPINCIVTLETVGEYCRHILVWVRVKIDLRPWICIVWNLVGILVVQCKCWSLPFWWRFEARTGKRWSSACDDWRWHVECHCSAKLQRKYWV